MGLQRNNLSGGIMTTGQGYHGGQFSAMIILSEGWPDSCAPRGPKFQVLAPPFLCCETQCFYPTFIFSYIEESAYLTFLPLN